MLKNKDISIISLAFLYKTYKTINIYIFKG